MERMVLDSEKRVMRMEKCILKEISIIADKVETVVAALSHCGLSSEPTFSALLTAAEVTQGSRVRCVVHAMPNGKAVNSGM